jgi:hypothetical protein
MRRTFPILAASVALLLALSAWMETASSQSLPSEGAKSGGIFGGGAGGRGSGTEPYRSPVSPPADNTKRNESPALDPRQGPGSSPIPGNSLGDTVRKQNDEAKRQREMIQRR